MGFFDFLKSKKKKKAEAGSEAEDVLALEIDPLEIDPPETRFTQEYKDYLAAQEAAERAGDTTESE